jgi:hypothetical protein
MTLPPCHQPDDDEPANPSRRRFMIGAAAATAGLIVTPLLGDAARHSYTNVNFAEYMVPTNAGIRSIDIIIVPEEDAYVNPIGAKGIGEIGIVRVAPAIANAVYHATGKCVRDLPITIEKLM